MTEKIDYQKLISEKLENIHFYAMRQDWPDFNAPFAYVIESPVVKRPDGSTGPLVIGQIEVRENSVLLILTSDDYNEPRERYRLLRGIFFQEEFVRDEAVNHVGLVRRLLEKGD